MKPADGAKWLPCHSARKERTGVVLHAFVAAVGGKRAACGFELDSIPPQEWSDIVPKCARCVQALASLPRAQRYQRARRALGMSQQQAATHLGVNLRTWQRWEAGETSPRRAHRQAVKQFLSEDRWSQAWGASKPP